MKVKTANWKFMMTVGMISSAIINLFIILFAAFIFNVDLSRYLSYRDVTGIMDYAIPFILLSPLSVAVISAVVVYRHSNDHKFRQSLKTAVLTAIISCTILLTVTFHYLRKFSNNYDCRHDANYCLSV
jgi:hypothetical protein